MFDEFEIRSPKRNSRAQSGWEGFFPYYAGYPETFVHALLTSAKLPRDTVVFDPWNGSGTTTYTAALLGHRSCGFDLNPVMVIIARARLLPPSEADSIEPLSREVVSCIGSGCSTLDGTEPLSLWFTDQTATTIRRIEQGIRQRLVGPMTVTPNGTRLEHLSGLAATFYVALFTVCRALVAPFCSSNPTWLRRPKDSESKIDVPREIVEQKLRTSLGGMAHALANRRDLLGNKASLSDIRLSDTTMGGLPRDSVDLILSSPPYCTRIDYTAATRIELAVAAPLAEISPGELSRQMIGSTRVPRFDLEVSPVWGQRCCEFLEVLRRHPSKASAGYYYKTHLDYFDKMSRSLSHLVRSLKKDGKAIFVVQDSYYKDIHNDLPSIVTDLAEAHGLKMCRRVDFRMSRSMSGVNPHTRLYKRPPAPLEAVLCFSKP